MNLPEKQEIAKWLKVSNTDRGDLAEALGVSKSMVDKWMSKVPIPLGHHAAIAKMMGVTQKINDSELNRISIQLSDDDLELVEIAVSKVEATIMDFIVKSTTSRAREEHLNIIKTNTASG